MLRPQRRDVGLIALVIEPADHQGPVFVWRRFWTTSILIRRTVERLWQQGRNAASFSDTKELTDGSL
jgi:hypothetical protein